MPVHPLLLKQQRNDGPFCMMPTKNTHSGRKTLPQDYLHRLCGQSPSSTTRPGIKRSFVMMAFRNAGRDAIQSLVSAALRQITAKSVMENGSRLSNTYAAVRWRQRFNSRESNVGYLLASHGTHFPDSLQKPLPAHADPHAKKHQMYRDLQHQDFLPR